MAIEIAALARLADVARNTATRYVRGLPIRPVSRRRIEAALAKNAAQTA